MCVIPSCFYSKPTLRFDSSVFSGRFSETLSFNDGTVLCDLIAFYLKATLEAERKKKSGGFFTLPSFRTIDRNTVIHFI